LGRRLVWEWGLSLTHSPTHSHSLSLTRTHSLTHSHSLTLTHPVVIHRVGPPPALGMGLVGRTDTSGLYGGVLNLYAKGVYNVVVVLFLRRIKPRARCEKQRRSLRVGPTTDPRVQRSDRVRIRVRDRVRIRVRDRVRIRVRILPTTLRHCLQ